MSIEFQCKDALLQVIKGITFDTMSLEYDVIAKFSTAGTKGLIQVQKGYNKTTPAAQITEELKGVVNGQYILVSGTLKISSYSQAGVATPSATLEATRIQPHTKVVDDEWLAALPGFNRNCPYQ